MLHRTSPLTPLSNNSINSPLSANTIESPYIKQWRSKHQATHHHPRRLYERVLDFATDNESSPFVASSSDEDTTPLQNENDPPLSYLHTQKTKKCLIMKPVPQSQVVRSALAIQTVWRRSRRSRPILTTAAATPPPALSPPLSPQDYTPLKEWKGQQTAIDNILKRLQKKNMLTPTQASNIATSQSASSKTKTPSSASDRKARKQSDEIFVKMMVEQSCSLDSSVSPSMNNVQLNCTGHKQTAVAVATATTSTTMATQTSPRAALLPARSFITNTNNQSTTNMCSAVTINTTALLAAHTTYNNEIQKYESRRQILMNDVADIRVVGYALVDNDHIEYRIGVACGTAFISNTTRRFREFVDLDYLIRMDLTRSQRNNLPVLPPKTYFHCTNKAFCQQRMKKLQMYLIELAMCPYVANTQALKSFVASYTNRRTINTPSPTPSCWQSTFSRMDARFEHKPDLWK